MSARAIIITTTVLLLSSGSVLAQSATDPARFQLERTEKGFIRLDKQTGDVSFCREEASGLTCRLAADERKAFEQELDALDKRVTQLETKSASRTSGLPSEEEVEKSLSIMERFFQRFMDIIGERRDEQDYDPNRT